MSVSYSRVSENASRAPGRPREFDLDQVLDKAVQIFRQRGYNGTSIADLAGAMGLVTGSIYKAFGDKRGLFLAAFDHYSTERDARLRQILSSKRPGRERLRDYLSLYVDVSYGADGERGCLVVASAVELATHDQETAKRIKSFLRRTETQLLQLIEEGQKDGSILTSVDPKATARLMLCIFQGFKVVGKVGVAKAETLKAADLAMRLLS